MEEVYAHKRFNSLYTKKIDLKTFFTLYSEKLHMHSYFKKRSTSLKKLLDIEDDKEFNLLSSRMLTNKALPTTVPKSFIPRRRFITTWGLYELPLFETNLDTLNNIKKEKMLKSFSRLKTSRYFGKVIMEVEKYPEETSKFRSLKAYSDYLVCVRILSLIGENKKYSPSQEFVVPNRLTLERIKDRIICEEDYQFSNPSVDRPDQSDLKRKMDLNKYGMFYIGETCYIDKRWSLSHQHDYSIEVQNWMSSRGLKSGHVEVMESTPLNSLHFRLGYPYLYIHQGSCEHLIIFTDARLVKQDDLLRMEAYPVLINFASLKGRYCLLCLSRLAKLCVTDCAELPYDTAFICNLCAYSFLYDSNGQKKCSFKLYKYIDRAAII